MWPGERGIRPVWGPAYVSFFGFGGFGSIGWLATGPCDPFFPWYGRGRFGFGFFGFNDFLAFRFGADFGRRFPGAFGPLHARFDERFSNFRQAERDPHILRSVNSERAGEFGHGAVAHTRGISADEFRNSRFTSGGVPAVPTRESLSATNRAANPGTIRNSQNTRFFGSNSRQPAQRASFNSFNQQAGRIQQGMRNSGLNIPASETRRSPAQPTRQNNTDSNRGGAQGGQSGVRSFEGQGTDRPNNSASQNSGGWHQFNGPANPSAMRPNEGNPNTVNRNSQPTQPRYQGNSRPPLDLRRPVVGGPQYNRQVPPRPTYNGNSMPSRPSYSAPSRPSYNPPSRPSGGSSRGSSGGGSHGSSGGSHELFGTSPIKSFSLNPSMAGAVTRKGCRAGCVFGGTILRDRRETRSLFGFTVSSSRANPPALAWELVAGLC